MAVPFAAIALGRKNLLESRGFTDQVVRWMPDENGT